ncbi:helix-turn-helix domain-containing protein [Oceanobacillus sp. CF4.6]|uniref:helix-turn-helix domain-containing protein n=1 Tax=Oceanobacillus sp. CF4.6 TaxID=3373080 RepID=UPI003EE5E236
MTFDELLGEYLRIARKRKRKIIAEIATEANVDEKHLGKIERGMSLPTSYTLFKIYKVLDIDINRMFDEISEKMNSEKAE